MEKCKGCGEVHKKHSIKSVVEAITESLQVIGYEMPFVVIAKGDESEGIVNCSMSDLEDILTTLFTTDSRAMVVGKSALLKAMLKK